MKRRLRTTALAALAALCIETTARTQYDGAPFNNVTVTPLGASIVRGSGRYDLQPSVMYDASDPNKARRFKMWWLGRYDPADADLPPADLHVGDRIYYAESPDGTNWSRPIVALKGRGGSGGFDAADDHLVGSPSVLKVHGKYYMFYEAYSQATLVTRFFHAKRGDTWSFHGFPQNSPSWDDGYAWERELGIAPAFRKHDAHPIYAGQVVYPDGKINRYLSAKPIQKEGAGTWTDLNGGQPVFWLYSKDAPGRKPLYAAFASLYRNSFVTDRVDMEGFQADGLHGLVPPHPFLGYAMASVTSPDMRRANQNRICLATSSDGKTWTRFRGAADGEAMIAPVQAFTNSSYGQHACGGSERFDLHRAYGAGFPVALIRDGHLELMFTDDTKIPLSRCDRPPVATRIRIPLEKIEDPQAYVTAQRQELQAGIPCDAKWSPLYRRYFGLSFKLEGSCSSAGYKQYPLLVWSDFDVSATQLPLFPATNTFSTPLPTQGYVGACGGLLGDEYGRTVDFPAATSPYTAMHVFYEAYPSGHCPTPFESDLHHLLVFGYPKDVHAKGVDFGLFVVPETQESHRSIHLRTVLGPPNSPFLIVLRSIDGNPVTIPLLTAVFDSQGRANIEIPLGIVTTSNVEIDALALDAQWNLKRSTRRAIFLR
ncbi:MAG: hypothetical protein H6832_17410 [Planctomycetes bacterium]|nr:hypothetical protein [Planctomycetota bacterium]